MNTTCSRSTKGVLDLGLAFRGRILAILLGAGIVLPLQWAVRADVREDGQVAATEGGAEAASGFSPKRYAVDRYRKIWEDSPFAFEIIVEEEEEEEENPFEDLKLAGLHQNGESYTVLVYDAKDPKAPRMRVNTDDFSASGFRVEEVVRGSTYRETEVVIVDRDGRRGTISYDDKRLESRPTGAVGAPTRAAPNPAQRGQPPGQAPQPGQPGQQPQQAAQINPTPQQVQAAQANQASRNEVIQRLLQRARENQQRAATSGRPGGSRSNEQAGGGDQSGRRRVVLPPSRR